MVRHSENNAPCTSWILHFIAKVIITANTSPLSGKVLPLKESLEVLKSTDIDVQHILVYKRTDAEVPMKSGRDEWLEEVVCIHLTKIM